MPTTADKRASSGGCTRAAASSFPTPGTSARRAICRHGLQGAGDDQCRLCLVAGLGRRRRHARRHAGAYRRAVGGGRRAHECRLRGRLCRCAGGRRRERAAVRGDRRVGPVDRGLHRRSRQAALRLRHWRWRASRRRARRSTRPAATCCSPAAARASSAAGPISTRPSAGCRLIAAAGADCLYAPGITTREQIGGRDQGGGAEAGQRADRRPSDLTVSDLPALGARRISVGGALARAAWGGSSAPPS